MIDATEYAAIKRRVEIRPGVIFQCERDRAALVDLVERLMDEHVLPWRFVEPERTNWLLLANKDKASGSVYQTREAAVAALLESLGGKDG